ncbi:MAG TPA: aldo/keto reductase, partial [Candidatus Binatia bacterium]
MLLKELGKTGVKLPEIGLGTWQYGGGTEPLRKGISLGAFLIDTAEMYGTEGWVGKAVQGRRDTVFIATKVSGNNLRYDDVLKAAEKSLKGLETEFIDLYQIHWPNPRIPLGETMRAMEELVRQGKVRFVGVSNFSLAQMKEAQASMKKYSIVANQVEYSLLDREIEKDLIPYCEKNGVTVLAYSPLARGRLAAKPMIRQRHAMGELQKVAEESGKTMAQVALNWCNRWPSVISLVKSDRVDRVAENCHASGW